MSNELSPYSIEFPERRNEACERYKNRVDRAYGPWTNLVVNRPSFRNQINRKPDRVLFERMTNEEIIELYGEERVKKVLKKEGLLGDEANLERIAGDRPAVFSFKNRPVVGENNTKQFSSSINIF